MPANSAPRPITPPASTYQLPLLAVSPFSPFQHDETAKELYKVHRYELDSDTGDDASDHDGERAHKSRLRRKAPAATCLCSDMTMTAMLANNFNSTDKSRTNAMRIAAERAETSTTPIAKQPIFDLDVSPSLALSLGQSLTRDQQMEQDEVQETGEGAGTKATPVPTLPLHLGIHPSCSSSRFSVGTFGPGPRSNESDAGTLRTSSSSRRRRRTVSTTFDANVSGSPPITASATISTRRASFGPDDDVDAAIDSLLLDLSRNNPLRIVPSGTVEPELEGGEFGTMDNQRPGSLKSRGLVDVDDNVIEPSSPIDPYMAPSTPTAHHQPHPFSPMSPGESIGSGHSRRHNSLDSLNPSIADSYMELLPQPAAPADYSYAFRAGRPVHRKGRSTTTVVAPASPTYMPPLAGRMTRNDLSPEQRAVLLRRTRKAEQVLGEQLCEGDVERHIIEPIHTARTVLTRISDRSEEASIPDSAVPEYDRRDVNPRTRPSTEQDESAAAAVRAFAAFGFGEKQLPSDLRVYVQKETRVAESSIPGVGGDISRRGSERDSLSRRGSERDGLSFREAVPLDERRHRRAQLAKLHKLLGVPVPASVLSGSPSPAPSDTPTQLPTHEISFLDFGDEESISWTQRVRSAMTGKRDARTSPPKIIMSTLRTSAPSSRRGSDNTARQRSTSEADVSVQHADLEHEQAPRQGDAYDEYASSLKSLMYLVEHDQASLANLMDTIENDEFPPHHPFRTSLVSPPTTPVSAISASGSSSAPASPITAMHGPNIHTRPVQRLSPAMLRARNEKLARFFGEADIDFTSPPPNFHIYDLGMDGRRTSNEDHLKRPRARQRQATAERIKKRVEVFDGLLGEMWSAVQKDVKGGKIKQDERDKLGDMMGAIRRRSTLDCRVDSCSR